MKYRHDDTTHRKRFQRPDHPEESSPEIQFDGISELCGLPAGFDNDDQRQPRMRLSGMVWLRKMLTTGESDLENALDHVVALRIAEYFAVEPTLGNRIKHIVCYGLPCDKQVVEEKIVPVVLHGFLGTKVTFGQKIVS
jgi:hypothetical protein